MGVPNGFGDSAFAGAANGLKGTGVGDADDEEFGGFANGLTGAGEGDLLNDSTFSVGESANRTCLLLCKPRAVPLPLTSVPFWPLCSRFAAFSSRSCSNGSGRFTLDVGPVCLKFE